MADWTEGIGHFMCPPLNILMKATPEQLQLLHTQLEKEKLDPETCIIPIKNCALLNLEGVILYLKGEKNKAVDVFQNVLKLLPRNLNAILNLLHIYKEEEEKDKVQEVHRDLRQIGAKTEAELCALKACAFFELNVACFYLQTPTFGIDTTIESYLKALELGEAHPDYLEWILQLAYCYYLVVRIDSDVGNIITEDKRLEYFRSSISLFQDLIKCGATEVKVIAWLFSGVLIKTISKWESILSDDFIGKLKNPENCFLKASKFARLSSKCASYVADIISNEQSDDEDDESVYELRKVTSCPSMLQQDVVPDADAPSCSKYKGKPFRDNPSQEVDKSPAILTVGLEGREDCIDENLSEINTKFRACENKAAVCNAGDKKATAVKRTESIMEDAVPVPPTSISTEIEEPVTEPGNDTEGVSEMISSAIPATSSGSCDMNTGESCSPANDISTSTSTVSEEAGIHKKDVSASGSSIMAATSTEVKTERDEQKIVPTGSEESSTLRDRENPAVVLPSSGSVAHPKQSEDMSVGARVIDTTNPVTDQKKDHESACFDDESLSRPTEEVAANNRKSMSSGQHADLRLLAESELSDVQLTARERAQLPKKGSYYDAILLSSTHDESELEELLSLFEGWQLKVCSFEGFKTGGKNVFENFKDAMYSCTYIVVVLTKNFLKDKWCEKHIHTSLITAIDDPEKHNFVVPIVYGLQDKEIPTELKSVACLKRSNRFYKEQLEKTITTLQREIKVEEDEERYAEAEMKLKKQKLLKSLNKPRDELLLQQQYKQEKKKKQSQYQKDSSQLRKHEQLQKNQNGGSKKARGISYKTEINSLHGIQSSDKSICKMQRENKNDDVGKLAKKLKDVRVSESQQNTSIAKPSTMQDQHRHEEKVSTKFYNEKYALPPKDSMSAVEIPTIIHQHYHITGQHIQIGDMNAMHVMEGQRDVDAEGDQFTQPNVQYVIAEENPVKKDNTTSPLFEDEGHRKDPSQDVIPDESYFEGEKDVDTKVMKLYKKGSSDKGADHIVEDSPSRNHPSLTSSKSCPSIDGRGGECLSQNHEKGPKPKPYDTELGDSLYLL
uniref:Uncharacterized protein LOC102802839 n=1 Tax=Saccoglossus kowalevskii TaxID=10224 RepID=A0ABM0LWF3_SACKO